jgi:hypothetical protein
MLRSEPPTFLLILHSDEKSCETRSPDLGFMALHTCCHCDELFIFKERRSLTVPQQMIVKKYGGMSHRRARKADITEAFIMNPYNMHLFNLCCAAFGVGDWQNFRTILSDVEQSNEYFEWIAHYSLGTADISNYWGLKVWPPQVKKYNTRAIAKVMLRDSDFEWPPEFDVLR